ncbi:MAG TPA: hypothetical protein VEK14_07030 [Rhodomicrobium sp.]|nr:hypothetical protein [Rhodomicrobium sp.]
MAVTIAGAFQVDRPEKQRRIHAGTKLETRWAKDMRRFDQGALLGGKVHFLDATEEEVVDLVRSLLFQLEIMASCLAMPPQQRKMLRANIGSFEAYLNCLHSTH